jgi:hypothetical protein
MVESTIPDCLVACRLRGAGRDRPIRASVVEAMRAPDDASFARAYEPIELSFRKTMVRIRSIEQSGGITPVIWSRQRALPLAFS